jgi:hypothetical protein
VPLRNHTNFKEEATFVANLGSTTTEDKFHGLYNAILASRFPTSKGYIIDHQVLGNNEVGRHKYIIVRRAAELHNPMLIVKLKRPARWNDAGKAEVLEDLIGNIEGWFDLTQYDTIYGLGGIGLHWMVCKMEKSASGSHKVTTVLDWCGDINSDLVTSHTMTSRL